MACRGMRFGKPLVIVLKHATTCRCSSFHTPITSSLWGHIFTHNGLNTNETLHHLAVMYFNKMDKKNKCEEAQH